MSSAKVVVKNSEGRKMKEEEEMWIVVVEDPKSKGQSLSPESHP
jgi:hypothetical protein